MLNSLPKIMSMTSFMLLTLSMLFSLINSSFIIEWQIYSMFSMNIKLDLMFEWSSILYSSIVMFISSNVLKFSNKYMKKY